MKRLLNIAVLGALLSGCAHSDAALERVLDDPLANDGAVLELTAYPYDLLRDSERYILCLDPCPTAERASRVVSVVWPLQPGRVDGFHGDTPVRLRVRFDAGCFRTGAVCPHRPSVFREEPPRLTQDVVVDPSQD